MKITIGYESMFGNTREVAEAIGDGIRQANPDAEVECLQVVVDAEGPRLQTGSTACQRPAKELGPLRLKLGFRRHSLAVRPMESPGDYVSTATSWSATRRNSSSTMHIGRFGQRRSNERRSRAPSWFGRTSATQPG
jgi:hypothetical protein